MFKTVHSFYCVIALEASLVLVKVLILLCISWSVCYRINTCMQEFTRIIGSIYRTGISSAIYCLEYSTVEPRLSDSRLSVPLIIQNDVQNFLKQVFPNCWACDPLFVVKQ